jgi:outer membrane lipoprotein-sorting protein
MYHRSRRRCCWRRPFLPAIPRPGSRLSKASAALRVFALLLALATLGGSGYLTAAAAVAAAQNAEAVAGDSATGTAAAAIATDRLKDLTATLIVKNADFSELEKIGGDFKTTYRFKQMTLAYKHPNKTRLETTILGRSVLIVYNGDTKLVRIPIRGTKVSHIAGEPGRKQSLLHLGIFAKDFLALDYKPVFLRSEKGLHVYQLVQRANPNHPSHEVVWVNPRTAIIERRRSIRERTRLKLEARYKNPVQARPGVWVPRRIEIYNANGKLAGVQEVTNIKVNHGVPDERFPRS